MDLKILHARGCATNQGIIGAACNCGAEAQAKITARQIAEWLDFEMDDAPPRYRLARVEKCLQELKNELEV